MSEDRGSGVFTRSDVRERTYKERDAWWTVWLVDPLASRLVLLVANRTRITPNQLTLAAFVLALAAALSFWLGSWPALAVGALLYHLSFTLDCVDGKIARLKGTGSVFGTWLDYVCDRLRVLLCTLTLMGGQYARSGEVRFLLLATAVVFLDMLRYLDALQLQRTHETMQQGIARVRSAAGNDQPSDLQAQFAAKFARSSQARGFLARHRIRPHLFSGVEFQMFVFIVGPLLNAVAAVTILSAVLLVAFEVVIIYRLWLSAQDFARILAAAVPEPAGVVLPVEGAGRPVLDLTTSRSGTQRTDRTQASASAASSGASERRA